MSNNTDSVIDRFPYPIISSVSVVVNYEIIADVNFMINANTASVLSKLVDGVYGRLIFKKSPIQYATVSYTVFVVPTNPRT